MSTGIDWEITHCAGYIVPCWRNSEITHTSDDLNGSSLDIDSPVIKNYFYPIFSETYSNCDIPIVFQSNEEGEQQNPINELIKKIAFGDDTEQGEASKNLAYALAMATDGRSPEGLLFTMAGVHEGTYHVVLWKFPNDEIIQADIANETLNIEIIKSAFSTKRGTNFFKAAAFKGPRANFSFWEGKIDDKQNTHTTSANWWVSRFLKALPNLTDEEGTKYLSRKLKKIINDSSQNLEKQKHFIAASITLKTQIDRKITIAEFASNYLPPEERESFLSSFKIDFILDIPFTIDVKTLDNIIGSRTLHLENMNLIINIENEKDIKINYQDETVEITAKEKIKKIEVGSSRKLK